MEISGIPAIVEEVHIWADKDKSERGQRAAQALAMRVRSQGCNVRIMIPSYAIPEGEKGIDWLDVLNMEDASCPGQYTGVGEGSQRRWARWNVKTP